MSLAHELHEAVHTDFSDEEMSAFLTEHPAVFEYGSEDESAVEDALNTLDRLHAEGVGDDMLRQIGSNAEMLALVVENVAISEALDILGEAEQPKGFKAGNPGNDPFATEPLHATDSAGKGGGTRPNPRTRTGECKSCSCNNYVCTCDCTSPKTGKAYTKTVDMRKYKTGKKAYMAHWRKSHGPQHPR